MENATKAMLIAAGVLMGVMILSLGLALYAEMYSYVESTQESVRFAELKRFNTQFTNYINYIGDEKQFNLTIQDVITVANIAFENNRINEATTELRGNESSLYVAVYLNGKPIEHVIHERSVELLSAEIAHEVEYTRYKCETVNYSSFTGRVYEIFFVTE